MKTNELISATIAVTVIVLVVVAVAAPLLYNAEQSLYDTTKYENEIEDSGQLKLKEFSAADSITVAFSTNGTLTVNSVDIDITNTTSFYNIVFMTDKIALRSDGDGKITVSSIASGSDVNVANITSFSLIASAGSMTYSINEGDAVQSTYTKGFVVDPNGTYINKGSTGYINSDDQIYGFRNADGTLYMYFGPDGGFANGVEHSMTVQKTVVEDTDNQVYTLTKVTYNGSVGVNAYIIPLQAEAVMTEHGTMITLIDLIPLLLVIGIVFAVIAIALYRRTA